MHESKCSETGVVGEEMACATWSRSAKGGQKSPNECAAGEFEALYLTVSSPLTMETNSVTANIGDDIVATTRGDRIVATENGDCA